MNSNCAVENCTITNRNTTMDTKALRQKILDLAIHGKLVPQDPNDEPASVLLERIKAEKERLIKEGKIKRSKKSAKTSDTPHYENVPFEVPEGWLWCKLENITVLIEDCPHTTAKDEGKGYPLVRTPNIGEGQLLLDGVHRVSKEVCDKRNVRAVPQVDDIIYAREAPAGNVAVIKENEQVCLGQRTVLIRPMNTLIDSVWLTYAMLAPYSRNHLTSKATGSTVTHVNMASIRPFDLPLPPLSEQHRIVAEIKRWFALIDQIEQGKADLQTIIKQTKSKILDLAIHGKLVPQDPKDEPAIELLKRINPDFTPCDNGHSEKLPQGWAYCKLSNVLRITMGQSPKGDSLSNKRGIEFHQGKICFSDKFLLKSKIFTDEPIKIAESNSILLCIRAPVGVVNITKRQICIGRGLCALNPFDGNTDFYFYLLQILQDSFENQSTGTTFKAISGEIIKNEKIALPPLSEQQRIVQKIEELFSALDDIQNALEV
mgnify:CR=1 FL=1